MVHPLTEQHEDRAAYGCNEIDLPINLHSWGSSQPDHYVLIPDTLIANFAHDPLTVGVYAAIARLAAATKDAIPVAARDLAAWMGSARDADRAAIMRRIVKLEEHGWVMVTRRTAAKNCLVPTWGRDRANTARPWRFDQADKGRPAHLRGRRVPLRLFDDYLGRLDPQSGHSGALISRYFTQPLLDLTDIGVYTIGLRAEVPRSPRLCHLGLQTEAGMLQPRDGRSLLILANSHQLTTLQGDTVATILLSVHGQKKLQVVIPHTYRVEEGEHLYGSTRGSPDGSHDRSLPAAPSLLAFPHPDAGNPVQNIPPPLIAWDEGISSQQTNQDSTPNHTVGYGGGKIAAVETYESPVPPRQATAAVEVQLLVVERLEQSTASLPAAVIEGHHALNPNRPIRPGEWYELHALQKAYGSTQLLIWQARAQRTPRERGYGITPGYYRACAARAACDTHRPNELHEYHTHTRSTHPSSQPEPAWADSRSESALQAMGVRERHKLSGVPYELIACWQQALAHPGMAAQFRSPIGFAVAQMQSGHAPPSTAELDRWHEQAQRTNNQYELWRYVETSAAVTGQSHDEQQLEARVRAIAPPDTDLADLCWLASALEAGATEAEALAQLRAKMAGAA